MRVSSVLLLSLALLVAGCLGVVEESLEAGAEDEVDLPAQDPPLPTTAASAALVGDVVETPFQYEGTTGTYACAFAVVYGTCNGIWGENTFTEVKHPGSILHMAGEVTWSSLDPLAQEFAVYLLVEEGGTWYWRENYPIVEGGSPLKFDWDLSRFAGKKVAISVSSGTWIWAMVAGAGVNVSEDFVVSGTVTSVTAE